MAEQPYIDAHEHLDAALKLLAQAKVEIFKAQKVGKKPYISHALGMVSMARNATLAAQKRVAQKIDEARQMPLEEEDAR